MSDIRKLLDLLNETTAGSVASVSTPLLTNKRDTSEAAEKPEVIEYGNWENSALSTSTKLKKTRDKAPKVSKSIYGEGKRGKSPKVKIVERAIQNTGIGSLGTKRDWLQARKALQDIQMDPEMGKDPEVKSMIMRRKLELDMAAKAKGWTLEEGGEKLGTSNLPDMSELDKIKDDDAYWKAVSRMYGPTREIPFYDIGVDHGVRGIVRDHPYIFNGPEGRETRNQYERGVAYGKGASGGINEGKWYTDQEMIDVVGANWDNTDAGTHLNDSELMGDAQAWLDTNGYSARVTDIKRDGDNFKWYIEGNLGKDLDEGLAGQVLGSLAAGAAFKSPAAAAMGGEVGSAIQDKYFDEGKTGPGLWANIRAKRARIKAGSGERMRKPGSKGAPTDAGIRSARGVSEDAVEEGFISKALAGAALLVSLWGINKYEASQVYDSSPQLQTLIKLHTDAKESGDTQRVRDLEKRIRLQKDRLSMGKGEVVGRDGLPVQVKEGSDSDIDRMLSNIERAAYRQGLKGGRELEFLRVKILDLVLNRVGRDKRKGYESHVMNVMDYSDAREFLRVGFRDAVEKGVEEDLDANQKRAGQLGPTGGPAKVGDLVGANESVDLHEMDSEGHKGHRGDEDPGNGPEKYVKTAKPGDVAKYAEKVLNKSMDNTHKKEVAEGKSEPTHAELARMALEAAKRATSLGNSLMADHYAKKYEKHTRLAAAEKKNSGKGVAEGEMSPMAKDSQKADHIRSLKNLIAIAKEQGRQLRVQELELELKKLQGVAEGMLDNPGEQDSPVAQAIIRRILMQRTDLLAKHGPEKIGQAVDEVADFVGDVDEIGSSDVSGWVRHVEQMLGNMEQGVAEGLEQDYLSQVPNLIWKPVSRSVWNTIQDEGLDEEQDAPNRTDWVMASLAISPEDAQALQALDSDTIEDFNRFDIHLKSRHPGLTDLIDYDNGTVTIVKPSQEQGVAEAILSPDEFLKGRGPIDKKSDEELQQHLKKKISGPGALVWRKKIKDEIARRKQQGVAAGYEPGDKITWYHSNHHPEIEGTVVGWKDGHLVVNSIDPQPRNTEKTVAKYLVPKNNILSHNKQGVAEGLDPTMGVQDPVVVISDTKTGKNLDRMTLSTAAVKYKLGTAQAVRDQLKNQDKTTIGTYTIALPMAGQTVGGSFTEGDDLEESLRNELERLKESDVIYTGGIGGLSDLPSGFIKRGKPDHEIDMAKSELYQASKNALEIYNLIKGMDESRGLDAWVQSKITKAEDYLATVKKYLEGRQLNRQVHELDEDSGESSKCPKCGGPAFSSMLLAEKKDACYTKVKSRYKVWPSAYASGALVKCRKVGAKNWGKSGK